MIPKIIHQVWHTEVRGLAPPNSLQQYALSWRNMNPGWRYCLWDDQRSRQLISDSFLEFLGIFDKLPYPKSSRDFFSAAKIKHFIQVPDIVFNNCTSYRKHDVCVITNVTDYLKRIFKSAFPTPHSIMHLADAI